MLVVGDRIIYHGYTQIEYVVVKIEGKRAYATVKGKPDGFFSATFDPSKDRSYTLISASKDNIELDWRVA